MSLTRGGSAPTKVDPWTSHARQWSLVGPPLRPSAEDLAVVEAETATWQAAHPNRSPEVLLLGVTPELATLPWPRDASLVAADRSEAMIAGVLPKVGVPQKTSTLCADWRHLLLPDASVDLAIGDGCFSIFDFPSGMGEFTREIRRVLRLGGKFVIRAFAAPPQREDLGAIADDLRAGKIGNFHCLKWRLAMALHLSAEQGTLLSDVYNACMELRSPLADLAAHPGFRPEVVRTIDAYENSVVRYTFSSVEEIERVCSGVFRLTARKEKRYELGERCPTLIFSPE